MSNVGDGRGSSRRRWDTELDEREEPSLDLLELLSDMPARFDEVIPRAAGERWREEVARIAETAPRFYVSGEHSEALIDAGRSAALQSPIDLPSVSGVAYIEAGTGRHDYMPARFLWWESTDTRLVATVRAVAWNRARFGPSLRADADWGYLDVEAAAYRALVGLGWCVNDARARKVEPRLASAQGRRSTGSEDQRRVYVGPASAWSHSAEPETRQSRWVVRGHWRRQWYARAGEHRPVWIEQHEAGNSDAPLRDGPVLYVVSKLAGDNLAEG